MGPFLFNGLRFALGAAVLAPFVFIRGLRPIRAATGGVLAGVLLFGGASLQQAGLVHTGAGNAGFVIISDSTDDEHDTSFFVFEEAGKLRFYATREPDSNDWDILPTAQYLCPTAPMSIDDTWPFIDYDDGSERMARVVAEENVTVGAGSYTAFKVRIELVSTPTVAVEEIWFAWGVGFVKNRGWWNGELDWRDELQSVTIIGGTGYMPAAVGNVWSYDELPVPVDAGSWGAVKEMYR